MERMLARRDRPETETLEDFQVDPPPGEPQAGGWQAAPPAWNLSPGLARLVDDPHDPRRKALEISFRLEPWHYSKAVVLAEPASFARASLAGCRALRIDAESTAPRDLSLSAVAYPGWTATPLGPPQTIPARQRARLDFPRPPAATSLDALRRLAIEVSSSSDRPALEAALYLFELVCVL